MAPVKVPGHALLSFDEYQHLLNLVLPLDQSSQPGLEYSVVLRFEPHMHPESQIIVRHWRDGRIETALYRVDKRNVWNAAYGNVTVGETPDFTAMTKQIQIFRNSFRVTGNEESQWHKELLPVLEKELAKTRKQAKHLDREGSHEMLGNGTRYELWYIQGEQEMHFVGLDSEVDTMTKGNGGLTKWMNNVRSYAESHLAPYTAPRNSPDEVKAPRTLLTANKK